MEMAAAKKEVSPKYVDTAKLLRDNIEVKRRRQLEGAGGPQGQLPVRAARREKPLAQLAAVFHCIHGHSYFSPPGEAKGAAGLPGHYHKGGQDVRGAGLPALRCCVQAANTVI